MINFITIINIDIPTWPLPTNTNVPKHTQNSYGMYYIYHESYELTYSNQRIRLMLVGDIFVSSTTSELWKIKQIS